MKFVIHDCATKEMINQQGSNAMFLNAMNIYVINLLIMWWLCSLRHIQALKQVGHHVMALQLIVGSKLKLKFHVFVLI
jgi:hypothetical protein